MTAPHAPPRHSACSVPRRNAHAPQSCPGRGHSDAQKRNRGHKMKHPSNRELFDYWNERRGERLAPERADIEPSAIRHILGDTFVLEVSGIESHLFRIAGTRLCALFGRELKSES